jgi:hypothetical protein
MFIEAACLVKVCTVATVLRFYVETEPALGV